MPVSSATYPTYMTTSVAIFDASSELQMMALMRSSRGDTNCSTSFHILRREKKRRAHGRLRKVRLHPRQEQQFTRTSGTNLYARKLFYGTNCWDSVLWQKRERKVRSAQKARNTSCRTETSWNSDIAKHKGRTGRPLEFEIILMRAVYWPDDMP